jgi:hypothetical protein
MTENKIINFVIVLLILTGVWWLSGHFEFNQSSARSLPNGQCKWQKVNNDLQSCRIQSHFTTCYRLVNSENEGLACVKNL